MKAFLRLIFLLTLMACQDKKLTIDEQHLDTYFKQKQNRDLTKSKDFFIVIISGNCGSCTEKTINFLRKIGSKNANKFTDYEKIVIIPDNNAEVLDSLKNTNLKIIVDEGYEMEKYGINFSKNVFFQFNNSRLAYKDWLYLDNVDTIAKKYGYFLNTP